MELILPNRMNAQREGEPTRFPFHFRLLTSFREYSKEGWATILNELAYYANQQFESMLRTPRKHIIEMHEWLLKTKKAEAKAVRRRR